MSLHDLLNTYTIKNIKDIIRNNNLHNKIKLGQPREELIKGLLSHYDLHNTKDLISKINSITLPENEVKPVKEKVKVNITRKKKDVDVKQSNIFSSIFQQPEPEPERQPEPEPTHIPINDITDVIKRFARNDYEGINSFSKQKEKELLYSLDYKYSGTEQELKKKWTHIYDYLEENLQEGMKITKTTKKLLEQKVNEYNKTKNEKNDRTTTFINTLNDIRQRKKLGDDAKKDLQIKKDVKREKYLKNIIKEDEEKQKKRQEQEEKEQLEINYQKRQAVMEKYKTFIHKIPDTNKNIKFRKWLRGYLIHTASIHFKTEDAEYKHIGKWDRTVAWDSDKLEQTFNETDYKIIEEIAREFGAFSY